MAQLGVQEGDVIQDVNGTPTTTPDEVADALENGLSEDGGDTIRIEVARGDAVEPIYVDISPSQP
jgi:S1-C subfamily serine protease